MPSTGHGEPDVLQRRVYYTPIDAVYKMPWHVLISGVSTVPAGFEGGTEASSSIRSPPSRLPTSSCRALQAARRQQDRLVRIAEECRVDPNPLKYYLK